MHWVLEANFFHLKNRVELNEEHNDSEGTLVTPQMSFQSLHGDLGLVLWFQ